MEDVKIARILADEFNKLSEDEEKVNRAYRESKRQEDKEVLEQLRDKKVCLCATMDVLGVTNLIDFGHLVRADLAPDAKKVYKREKLRVEQIAEAIVESYNQAEEMLDECELSDAGVFDAKLVKREASKYLKLLGLGVIRPDGKAVVEL